MNRKTMVLQLNNEKGITAADALIAILIIMTAIGVIAMVYSNLVIGSRGIDRKTGATRIATNLVENINGTFYDEIESTLRQSSNSGSVDIGADNTYIINGTNISQEGTTVFNTTIPAGYIVRITIKNVGDLDLLKEVKIKVEYKVNGKNETVELGKVIEREQIPECNSPQFEGVYLEQLEVDKNNYIMSYQSAENSGGNKIICPIKYTGKKYEIMTADEAKTIWYSYSNKQWARVLVLTDSEYGECIDDSAKIAEKLKSDKSYVWIPRFGVENSGEVFGSTYFKYKSTNHAILNSYENGTSGFIYNHLDLENPMNWSNLNGISFDEETNELLGRWEAYSDIQRVNTDAYKLNQSQFGPLLED